MLSKLSNILDVKILSNLVIGYLPNVFMAIILFFLFWFANKLIQQLFGSFLKKMKVEKEPTNLLLKGARVGLYIFAFLTIADQLQINIKSLLAGVGVIGLALSFAAKDTVGNIISGIVIIIDKPFKEGDWVSLGSLDATVTQIRLRTTVLTTFNNETVVVPNQQISQERIINYTITPKIRVKIPISIAYKESISAARTALLETTKGDTQILQDPLPRVIVTDLGGSGVNLQLRFWIENSDDQYTFIFKYTEKCKIALDKAGIEIPYPHLQLFVEDTKGIRVLSKSASSDSSDNK
ncbi:MAG: mechanosensitive ion channel [Desulfobacula sp.]|nr:mechanosensitive ion channel [Desulfobacula sp.]